ncbi:Ferric reduction oxidase 7, chloroplastic [Morella rubra]|uniref:Ferric reduction oxidase 7, chloroplastic n=1 Tax=Morella rubra TaxID=262757 RepID=A0A6A1VK95_9ROSI|nr:Ferric reduction oxidase 7, chloroplastic [Morella rubra]
MAMDELHSAQQSLLFSNGGDNNKNKIRKKGIFGSLAKWILKFTMWVIFVLWVAMFCVVPTDLGSDLYDDWIDATSGALFGKTGSALLLYSGPIIMIAFLAVPYLLLSGEDQQEEELQEKRPPRFRLWTFPVLVEGPFGVVSAAEFIGIILFVVFVLWTLYANAVVNFELLPSYGDLTFKEMSCVILEFVALGFGATGSYLLAFFFLPIARGSVLLRLIGIPFEHATRYHVWLGHLSMLLFTLHGAIYLIAWSIEGHLIDDILEWGNLAGVISLLSGLLMWVTSLHPVRKQKFELFFYTHQLYAVFVFFFAQHAGFHFNSAAGGIFLFIIDRFLRFCQSRRTVDIISAKCLPCGTVELILSKPASNSSSQHTSF